VNWSENVTNTCPRCGSPFINHGICIKCGETLEKITPYYLRSCDYHGKKSYGYQKKYRVKECCNCGRVKWLVGGKLCGACKAQVYNPAKNIHIEPGTKEYKKALKLYREARWPEKFKSRREE
jgi:ribosomal protein L32